MSLATSELRPSWSKALLAAMELHRAGRTAEAERAYRRRVAEAPNDGEAWRLLGALLQEASRHKEAMTALRRAVELLQHGPSAAEARRGLAAALGSLGRHNESVDRLKEALQLRPEYPEAWHDLGVALERTGLAEQAVRAQERAIQLRADYPEAHNQMGSALRTLGELHAAAASHRRALELRPQYPQALRDLAATLVDAGDLPGALDTYRKFLALSPTPSGHSDLVMTMQYDLLQTPEELSAEARRWADLHAAPQRKFHCPHDNDRGPERRLRVGYVSPDLRDHPVGRLMEPLLARHDRSQVQVFCYSDALDPPPGGDLVAAHLRGLADVWRETRDVDNAALAELIRRDKIDILVETAGHFIGNRLVMMARRPAPVQVSGFGYCATTGMAEIDYRLTDAISDPPGQTEQWHTEELVRLPNAWCYRPFEPTPDVGPLPARRTGHVTFGNLNNPIKTVDAAIALWSRIMQRVPGSRLVLLGKRGADAYLLAKFAAHAVSPDRIEFFRPSPRAHYLRKFNEIDIALDPFPFNGDNSTCDAMWMGVPVVSLIGRTFASRRGLAHLSSAGLAGLGEPAGLAAETGDQYVERAVALASDLPRLASIRAGLRQRMLGSPLADAAGYVRELEAAYRRMWRRWCERP